jgi:hypothetical protein
MFKLLRQNIFQARHNLHFDNHKKLDRMRNIMQKIGDHLVDFSILNEFWKLMEEIKMRMDQAWQI